MTVKLHQLLGQLAGLGSDTPIYLRGPNSPEEFSCRLEVLGLGNEAGITRIVLHSEGVGDNTHLGRGIPESQPAAPVPEPGPQSNFAIDGGTPATGEENASGQLGSGTNVPKDDRKSLTSWETVSLRPSSEDDDDLGDVDTTDADDDALGETEEEKEAEDFADLDEPDPVVDTGKPGKKR